MQLRTQDKTVAQLSVAALAAQRERKSINSRNQTQLTPSTSTAAALSRKFHPRRSRRPHEQWPRSLHWALWHDHKQPLEPGGR